MALGLRVGLGRGAAPDGDRKVIWFFGSRKRRGSRAARRQPRGRPTAVSSVGRPHLSTGRALYLSRTTRDRTPAGRRRPGPAHRHPLPAPAWPSGSRDPPGPGCPGGLWLPGPPLPAARGPLSLLRASEPPLGPLRSPAGALSAHPARHLPGAQTHREPPARFHTTRQTETERGRHRMTDKKTGATGTRNIRGTEQWPVPAPIRGGPSEEAFQGRGSPFGPRGPPLDLLPWAGEPRGVPKTVLGTRGLKGPLGLVPKAKKPSPPPKRPRGALSPHLPGTCRAPKNPPDPAGGRRERSPPPFALSGPPISPHAARPDGAFPAERGATAGNGQTTDTRTPHPSGDKGAGGKLVARARPPRNPPPAPPRAAPLPERTPANRTPAPTPPRAPHTSPLPHPLAPRAPGTPRAGCRRSLFPGPPVPPPGGPLSPLRALSPSGPSSQPTRGPTPLLPGTPRGPNPPGAAAGRGGALAPAPLPPIEAPPPHAPPHQDLFRQREGAAAHGRTQHSQPPRQTLRPPPFVSPPCRPGPTRPPLPRAARFPEPDDPPPGPGPADAPPAPHPSPPASTRLAPRLRDPPGRLPGGLWFPPPAPPPRGPLAPGGPTSWGLLPAQGAPPPPPPPPTPPPPGPCPGPNPGDRRRSTGAVTPALRPIEAPCPHAPPPQHRTFPAEQTGAGRTGQTHRIAAPTPSEKAGGKARTQSQPPEPRPKPLRRAPLSLSLPPAGHRPETSPGARALLSGDPEGTRGPTPPRARTPHPSQHPPGPPGSRGPPGASSPGGSGFRAPPGPPARGPLTPGGPSDPPWASCDPRGPLAPILPGPPRGPKPTGGPSSAGRREPSPPPFALSRPTSPQRPPAQDF
ncbi:basic proline-rich protein-like [Odocoileus virginianus]|uniref:Basic proline-rich protein-like n=1 Tax=Odocoileus virginianus TaxID=9874 RepID=A0ABM4HX91_ODOVR